jgi:uncharacterized protein (TIGR03435 family)
VKLGRLLLLGVALHAQGPVFEVTSVKRNNSNDPNTFRIDPLQAGEGRFHATNTPVKRLLALVYQLGYPEILGGPAWLESDGYDFEGKVDGKPSRAELLQMVQALLGDRFRMKAHRESRQVPVYALVLGKGGAKLRQSSGGPPNFRFTARGLEAKDCVIAPLAMALNEITGRPVNDETGLKGLYDFTLEWHGNDPSIYLALEEQLGLKLEARKAQIEHLVIERIERPNEN